MSLSDTNIHIFTLGTLTTCVTSTASEIFVFAYYVADYQNSCTEHTELHHVCTLAQYSVDVEITTALNCLNNSVVERNPL
jgi:hypothetical protein